MNKKGKLYKIVTIILTVSMLISWYTPFARAATMTDIRIGLAGLYEDQPTIKFKTTNISLGYSIQNSYASDEMFYSEDGFVFQPATGYFYILDQTYQTYAQAMKSVKQIHSLGVECYPVSIYRDHWMVYIGNKNTIEEMDQVKATLDSNSDNTYTGPVKDNGHRVLVTGNKITFLYDGEVKGAYPQFKAIEDNESIVKLLDLGERQYRGRIEIGRYSKQTLTAINVINIESYLYGVVPAEMVSSWPKQALRAQAVCARSFAISKTKYGTDSDLTNGYAIDDTKANQVYRGYGSETVATNAAVDATRGEVVAYKGNVITAYYSSTSGGRTEDGADVWGMKKPYLASVVDEFETEPEREPWVVAITKSEMEVKLSQAGIDIGSVQKVIAEITTVSGRVYSLKVVGSKKSEVIQSQRIRDVFDLDSTKFKIVMDQEPLDRVAVRSVNSTISVNLNNCSVISGNQKVTDLSNTDNRVYIVKSNDNLTPFAKDVPTSPDVIYFVGLGFGHGAGMSQSGAKGLAKQGYSYQQIIQYYYKGCYVKQL